MCSARCVYVVLLSILLFPAVASEYWIGWVRQMGCSGLVWLVDCSARLAMVTDTPCAQTLAATIVAVLLLLDCMFDSRSFVYDPNYKTWLRKVDSSY